MGQWVKYSLDLYSIGNSITQAVLDVIEDLPVLEALDAEPTVDKLSKVTDALICGKTPGEEGISPEIIKCGKPALLKPLHELLCLWREGKVPQDMRNAKIVILYKNKDDHSDFNRYQGISLLSAVGKVFTHVVLTRLQVLADRIDPESQCSFRAERSIVDMIFSIRQLQEKCREQHMLLYIAYINLTNVFDLVSRRSMFQLLKKISCPP